MMSTINVQQELEAEKYVSGILDIVVDFLMLVYFVFLKYVLYYVYRHVQNGQKAI